MRAESRPSGGGKDTDRGRANRGAARTCEAGVLKAGHCTQSTTQDLCPSGPSPWKIRRRQVPLHGNKSARATEPSERPSRSGISQSDLGVDAPTPGSAISNWLAASPLVGRPRPAHRPAGFPSAGPSGCPGCLLGGPGLRGRPGGSAPRPGRLAQPAAQWIPRWSSRASGGTWTCGPP